jgi:hypothetical protein
MCRGSLRRATTANSARCPKTRQLFEAFEKAGGVVINPLDADLRAFVTLRQMREQAAGRKVCASSTT